MSFSSYITHLFDDVADLINNKCCLKGTTMPLIRFDEYTKQHNGKQYSNWRVISLLCDNMGLGGETCTEVDRVCLC